MRIGQACTAEVQGEHTRSGLAPYQLRPGVPLHGEGTEKSCFWYTVRQIKLGALWDIQIKSLSLRNNIIPYYIIYILTQVSQVLELASSEQGNICLLAAYQRHTELK